jgi:hypothetical protein
MKLTMKIQKYLLLQLSYFVFRFSFFALATAITLLIVFGNSDHIKRAFVAANAYARFIPELINNNAKANNSNSAAFTDPNVQKVIQESFPAETLQTNTEAVIDSTYAWLNGKTAEPDFAVDFTPNINHLADNLSAYAMARLRSLPVCTVQRADIDPFTTTCRPILFDYGSEQKALAQSIKSDNGILPKTQFTADDLPKSATGQSFTDQYAYAPRLFVLLYLAPAVLASLACGSALLIVYFARRKREAVHSVGINIASSSIFIILSPLFYIYVLPRIFPSLSAENTTGSSAIMGDVAARLAADFNNWLIIVGVLLALAGLGIVTLERSGRPKSKYIKLKQKTGLTSSNKPRAPKPSGQRPSRSNIPILTSEGERLTSKYQKDKRYRKIPKKEL